MEILLGAVIVIAVLVIAIPVVTGLLSIVVTTVVAVTGGTRTPARPAAVPAPTPRAPARCVIAEVYSKELLREIDFAMKRTMDQSALDELSTLRLRIGTDDTITKEEVVKWRQWVRSFLPN